MVGVELFAVGALLFVVDVIAYSRYREAKERHERLSDLDRTARIQDFLHEEVVEPVRDLPGEELTKGKELPAVFEEAEFLTEAPGEFHAEAIEVPPSPAPEGELVFLPPAQHGLAAAFSPLTGYPAEPEGPRAESRLRDFEEFQRRSEAELSMLRASLEDLHTKLHELKPADGEAKDPKGRKLPSLRTLKARRDKLERELKVLQRRYMKRQVDAQTFGRLTADLQRELNRVHADALERAEAVRRK